MDKDWVVICSADGEIEGDIIKGSLESEGIPVMLRQEAIGGFYAFDVIGEVKILVPPLFKEKALKIISLSEKSPPKEENIDGSGGINE